MTALLEVEGLSQAIRRGAAVDDCSFAVEEGTITAIDRAERIGQDDGLQP